MALPAEDPTPQIESLYQCLASNKKSLGVFLGAGCPMSVRVLDEGTQASAPLIPDVENLTKVVRDQLVNSDTHRESFALIDKHLTSSDAQEATVEDLLTYVRSLAAVAGNDEIRGLTAEQLASLDEYICNSIHDAVNCRLPRRNTPYHSVAKWANAIAREYPVEVFTPNYDLLVEQAMEEERAPYFDGFSGAMAPFFDASSIEDDRLPPHWTRIWKLHGSINWYQSSEGEVFRSAQFEKGQRRVIHPTHLKYEESRRMPYLAMLDRLRNFLKVPTSTLVFCGYSFRDEHINDTIAQGLLYSRTTIAYALLFDDMDKYPHATELGRRHPNLVVIGRNGGTISGREVEWSRLTSHPNLEIAGQPIIWTPAGQETSNQRLSGEFRLGDFAAFGKFLESLLDGTQRIVPSDKNGK